MVQSADPPVDEIEQAVYELAIGAATTVERVTVDAKGNKTKQVTRVKHQPNLEAIRLYLKIKNK